jgi:hypothetical protein
MSTEASQNETRLPRAVREQMLRVNNRLEAKSQPGAEADPAINGAEATPAPAVTETDPPSGATPPAPPADPRENDPAYWRQRFNVTQGMLRSFQERQAAENADRDRELAELREKIRTLETKNRTEPSALDLKLFFTEDQIEHFGEGQCEAMARAAMTAAGQQAQAVIEAEVKPIRERSEARDRQAAESKEAAFWEKLAELAPNYQEINARQDWLAWLAEVDDATGMVRQDILDRHRGALNGAGVAKMFTTFEKSLQRPKPPVAAPRNAAGGAGGEAPAVPTKGYPSPSEIKDFFKRASIGKVTDKERADFDARLKSKHAA